MKRIGDNLDGIENAIARARTRRSSNADRGSARGVDRDSSQASTERRRRWLSAEATDAAATEPELLKSAGDGDPACPRCHGVGWLMTELPLGHPDYGRATPCSCIEGRLAERRLAHLRRTSSLAALGHMTFERFRLDAPGNNVDGMRSLQVAYEASVRFADQPEGWLVFIGTYGSGKTHLGAAIANRRLAMGESVLFEVVPDLLDHLRSTFAPDSDERYDERFETIRRAPLLVLDDLGAQSPTPWAAEKLFQLLNYRYNAQLPTVITTNKSIETLDERLASRLGHVGFVRLVELRSIDYRGGILPEQELSTLPLYEDMTFERWDHRTATLDPRPAENLHKAYDLAQGFARSPKGWLVFTGEHGSGKTHLAAAIANAVLAAGGDPMFVVVPDLLDHLRAAFGPSSRVQYDKRFDLVRSAELLVLDDLGVENATSWAQEKLYQILNHRYVGQLATVITLGAPLSSLDSWLRARMFDKRRARVFQIEAGPYYGGADIPAGQDDNGGRRTGPSNASRSGAGSRTRR